MCNDDPDQPIDDQKTDEEWEVIHAYSRANALADGMLIDVSERAKEMGIKPPTALTRAVWDSYVALTPAAKQAGNDEQGRLWDVLWMFRCAAVLEPDTDRLQFQLHVVTDSISPTLVTLKAILGPGDHGEPVLTILLPDED
jgi:hypothetical protein